MPRRALQTPLFRDAGALFGSWFRLTRDEQLALLLVLALFCLGLAVQSLRTPSTPPPETPPSAEKF